MIRMLDFIDRAVCRAVAAGAMGILLLVPAPAVWADCTGKVAVDFVFTGSAQSFLVPAGVTSVYIEAAGAEGGVGTNNAPGCTGGLGGSASGDLVVAPGETLNVLVGGGGGSGTAAGFNGGGAACADVGTCGSGGGASDVRQGGASLVDRVLVAGGGGGTEWTGFCAPTHHGGNGGGLSGDTGCGDSGCLNPSNGDGGSQFAGGAASPSYGGYPAGSPGALGIGGDCTSIHCGAGGGGYYGGGGASADGSGGGGSSYVGGVTGGLTTSGVQSGGGTVRICYTNCGNAAIDPGEQCDDGNTANGDCCSSTCQYEPNGNPCDDQSVCTQTDLCNGSGICVGSNPQNCDDSNGCTIDSCDPIDGCDSSSAVLSNCRTAEKSLLLLKQKNAGAKDKLVWKWIKGQSTDLDDLDNPVVDAEYALCVYAGTAETLIAAATVPAHATKWTPISDKGFKYTDTGLAEDGIQKVLVKGSTNNKSKALVKGKGAGLPDPVLGAVPYPVVVQLVNNDSGVCLQGTFDSGDEIKNTTSQFKAKAQ